MTMPILLVTVLLSSCTRKQKPDRYHYYQSFEELNGWFPTPPTLNTTIIPHSGIYSIYTDENYPYSNTLKIKFKDIDTKMPKKMKAAVWCYTSTDLAGAKLCLQIKNDSNEYKLWAAIESKDVVTTAQKWTKLEITAEITKALYSPENEIALYVWNPGKDKVFLDDFSLEIFQ